MLGYDAAGVVVATGTDAKRFAVGDEVFYAGTITRPGTNAELHVVDERLVGHKPASLDFADAAALPLTTITAGESLFIHLGLDSSFQGTLLVVGGAGGVGSMVTQLARARIGARVIATASRPESVAWAARMGAHHVVDHHQFANAVRSVTEAPLDWIFSVYSSEMADTYASLLRVGGTVVAIDDPNGLDITPLKAKSQAWRWEAMFARPRFEPESALHGDLLNEAARLVDAGTLTSTRSTRLDGLSPETLGEAHRLVASSQSVGKTVIVRA